MGSRPPPHPHADIRLHIRASVLLGNVQQSHERRNAKWECFAGIRPRASDNVASSEDRGNDLGLYGSEVSDALVGDDDDFIDDGKEVDPLAPK